MSNDRDLFIAYGVLMAGAVAPIYFGSYSSLKTPKTTRDLLKAAKQKRRYGDDSDDSDSDSDSDSEDDDVIEKVTSSDAMWFPIMGSAVLFGLFLIFKYLNKKYVNFLLSFYFGFVGCLALSQALVSFTRGVVGRELWKKLPNFRLSLDQRGQGRIFKLSFTTVDVALVAVSALLVGVYLVTKNWIISNLLALSLSLNAIALMSLDSFRTGAIMLGGLFVYDIFWVFATPVMVSVARNFDAPIKIVWPKNIIEAVVALQAREALPKLQFTMLGLGDIVIPGIFVALALRYDQLVASEAKPSVSFTKSYTRWSKPYFTATLVAYVAGLATTMGVMHFFKAAQPALLYLSPACTGAVFLTAALRGEFKQVWNWTDGEEEDKDENKKEQAKKEDGQNGKDVKTARRSNRRSAVKNE
ncbi:Peptidase A22B, signal peptide peptidase [Kalmanozyma brasiliensis GHG001]|uniref:Signal peptide peptidase n=1 Tax=Kalmanozyma brasiliensis (strain GHG001) TaxID=1365824 RepID=V5ER86_KALBG|nr:Peptidase A22B, signal peptide peptidase [Kalmanozyma brasiliensis GHG001]EST05458.1 Peptidase A22B, signal peptide peptidase [Kalmanozyma brasiliensis GHG001]